MVPRHVVIDDETPKGVLIDVDINFEDVLAQRMTAPWLPDLVDDQDTRYFHDFSTVDPQEETANNKNYVAHEGSSWFQDF